MESNRKYYNNLYPLAFDSRRPDLESAIPIKTNSVNEVVVSLKLCKKSALVERAIKPKAEPRISILNISSFCLMISLKDLIIRAIIITIKPRSPKIPISAPICKKLDSVITEFLSPSPHCEAGPAEPIPNPKGWLLIITNPFFKASKWFEVENPRNAISLKSSGLKEFK